MPPRRSHKKSRAGCKRCKVRKIKCDEVHPQCGNCLRHGVPCDFENPNVTRDLHAAQASTSPSSNGLSSASPAPAPASAVPLYRQPGTMITCGGSQRVGRLTELRLMHQYTQFTHKTLNITTPQNQEANLDIWRNSIPAMAFAGNQQLMDAILAIAALHIRSYSPNDKDIVRASHAYMASCLSSYSASLAAGIDASNAPSMFITAVLIAMQSTASRIFTKDESHFAPKNVSGASEHAGFGSNYQPPLTWFHSFQGVKTVVAASWSWLKESDDILSIIDAQPVLNLNFSRATEGFFGHLLHGMHDEVAARYPCSTGPDGSPLGESELATSTRQAYQHAVATLNWAHTKPGNGALSFPATVSKRFVELIEERQPRALAILAAFFALLKVLDNVWWLQGMARREVLGIVSLFNSDLFGPELEKKWWPHLEWAVRIALYDTGQSGQNYIPAEVWGAAWNMDGDEPAGEVTFTNHIDMLSDFANTDNPRAGDAPLPPPPSNVT